jgi:uncharacterized protein (UPF0332 family)
MTDNTSEISANLQRAETNLHAAKDLIDKEYFDIAAARALLLSQDIDTNKHSGVIALIHQRFVKTGKLDKEQGKSLNWLFEMGVFQMS